jgi:transposase-like protein
VTRIGKIELRVPQDRQGRFSTELFERYQRAEQALMAALAEMYVQRVSTRKVKAITEELIGHSFSASSVSAVVKKLDGELARFAHRRLTERFAYLVLDARYEKVRIDSVIQSQAVLIAVGIDWEGRRQILGIELANRESRSSWRDFLMGLKERGLHGVEFVVSDDHDGLKKAIAESLSGAAWQRCYVHFLRNAIDHLPRKRDDDCVAELRWLYDRRQLKEARADIKAYRNLLGPIGDLPAEPTTGQRPRQAGAARAAYRSPRGRRHRPGVACRQGCRRRTVERSLRLSPIFLAEILKVHARTW